MFSRPKVMIRDEVQAKANGKNEIILAVVKICKKKTFWRTKTFIPALLAKNFPYFLCAKFLF